MDFSPINQIAGTDQPRDTANFVALTSAGLVLGLTVTVKAYRVLRHSSRR